MTVYTYELWMPCPYEEFMCRKHYLNWYNKAINPSESWNKEFSNWGESSNDKLPELKCKERWGKRT